MARTAKAKIEYQVADAMEQKLAEWRENLPSYFISADVPAWFLGPRAVVLWKEQNLRILIWRGSKRYHSFLPSKIDSERRCIDVAMQTIHDISRFCSAYEGILHLGINWYATYFLFQATLVLEACRLGNGSEGKRLDDDHMLWQSCMSEVRNCLEILAQNNSSASRCLELLDRIHNHFAAVNTTVDSGARPNASSEAGKVQEGYQIPETFPSSSSLDYNIRVMGESELGLNDFAADPTFRMLVDQTPLDFFNDIPLDVLFDNNVFSQ